MEVKTVSNQTFAAKTSVKAAPDMLSAKQIKTIVAEGSKVGTPKDVIQFNVGALHESKAKKGVQIYDFSMTSKIGSKVETFQSAIPVDKFKPFDYIMKRLSYLTPKK